MSDLLTVTISPTAQGDRHYLQILSADGWSLNIILFADEIEVVDQRRHGAALLLAGLVCPTCGGSGEKTCKCRGEFHVCAPPFSGSCPDCVGGYRIPHPDWFHDSSVVVIAEWLAWLEKMQEET